MTPWQRYLATLEGETRHNADRSRRLAQELTQRQARKYVPFTERIGA